MSSISVGRDRSPGEEEESGQVGEGMRRAFRDGSTKRMKKDR